MPARIEIAPELIAEGKYLYEETLTPTDEIGARMGLSRSAFYLRVKEWKWKRRRYSSGIAGDAAVPSTPVAVARDTSATPPAEPPLAFAERLRRVLDGELAVIERTLKVLGPASNAEAERTTRILAAISRTVQEIQASAEGQASSDETDDDAVPGDIDEFREALARRLQGFIDARRGRSGSGDDGVGTDIEREGT
jgi:AcrR family transcriptional regulator